METIAWVGFSQAAFAAIILLVKRGRSTPDKILSAWLFLLALEFLICAIDCIIFGGPLLSSSFLLFNPAFYIYSRSLVQSDFKLRPIQLLHLLPFVFFEVFGYIYKEPYILFGYFEFDTSYWFRLAFAVASVVSWATYNYSTARMVYKHRVRLVNEFSNIESNKRVTWLFFVIIFYNLYCFLLLVSGIFNIFLHVDYPVLPIINYSTLLVMVYILGFYGLQQELIFKKESEALVLVNGNGNGKNNSQFLSAEQTEIIKGHLYRYFKDKRPYLNSELSMDMLSKELGYPKHHITEVLNKEIGKNFFQFVNEYRVEAVKEMLSTKSYFSIEAIGYECGFNSKSSFFSTFKKSTGFTPLQYRSTLI